MYAGKRAGQGLAGAHPVSPQPDRADTSRPLETPRDGGAIREGGLSWLGIPRCFGPLWFLVISVGSACWAAEDPFAAHVRPTEPLSPQAQQKTFHLPPGFAIELVASEPDIPKPMNLAFDARGRLWVTGSYEYPYAAPLDRPGKDSVKVLEDTDGDGKIDRITTFAEGLNIPIGVYPYRNGAIVFSIPNIDFHEDTNGDGVADKRTRLLGPFGYERDTHGLNNAFRRGLDGWLYACHGFNNETKVAGADGAVVAMNSGNTYRFRADGSRIEQFTWGQVNPFGMTTDERGNWFTADCHSSPIYQLLRSGYYPSFGKPHDGLGFVPPMMTHSHGSTAIAGIVHYAADRFPPEFRGNIFVGNVMTSRINRDVLEYHGSTIKAKEASDFVTADDPWFRPVDLQLGPDGAIYVADFYNRIIGHYEVRLDHPQRDRFRGRIWRIVFRGDKTETGRRFADLSQASAEQLLTVLADGNLTNRLLATTELSDRLRKPAAGAVRHAVQTSMSATVRAHGLWVLYRLGELDESLLAAAARDADPLVRDHGMRILAETKDWTDRHRTWALRGLNDIDAFVRRSAAEAIGLHPSGENVRPLLDLIARSAKEDVLLRHAARIALRNQLRPEGNLTAASRGPLTEVDARTIAGVALAIPSAEAAEFLLTFVQTKTVDRATAGEYLEHAARYVRPERIDSLVSTIRRQLADDLDSQHALYQAVERGVSQRGGAPSPSIRSWAEALAESLIASVDPAAQAWWNVPLVSQSPANPWVFEERRKADGTTIRVFSSFPKGEHLTGRLRSATFTVPQRLSFSVAGHDGYPDKPAGKRNLVRLRHGKTLAVLREAHVPRNDTATRVDWDLNDHAGEPGVLEVVDGDTGPAYAWLAVAEFDPPVVTLGTVAPATVAERLVSAARIVERHDLKRLLPQLRRMVANPQTDLEARAAAALALVHSLDDGRLPPLADLLAAPEITDELRNTVAATVLDPAPEQIDVLLAEVMKSLPSRLERSVAERLAGSPAGANALIDLCARGLASARLLLVPAVRSRLTASKGTEIEPVVRALVQALPATNVETQKLIDARRAGFAAARTDVANGAQLFGKHCEACHRIGNKGAEIGPQLDGIGNRGVERLLEDILDSNRNVDVAFRTTLYVLTDGSVTTGLFRKEEGQTLVLADSNGKELRLNKDQIETSKPSVLSLMPDNFGERLTASELFDLVAYLLTQRPTQ